MVTLGIVGAGFMGSAHAASYAALGGRVRVKAVCGRSFERAAKVAASVGASPTTELEALLADDEIDAVDICVPTPLHREVAVQAFAARKHVFLEKPIALTVDEANAIMAAADLAGTILMVGLALRYRPEYVALRRLVERGDLGRPKAVSTRRLSPPADWADWLRDPAQSGGTPVDLMVHDFDQMNALLGAPRSVYATEPQPGHVHAIVQYGDASGVAEGSTAMPRSYPSSSEIRVLGESGVAECAEGNGASSSARGLRVYPAGGEPRVEEAESAGPSRPELEAFVACVEEGRRPEQGTGEQARRALQVSLAAARSLASGRPEPV
ncbi:MAG TPA: Gfo/Idh/MocA family oxidoreductase [Gaiellaceae bacterium]|nr:Gfo/Idh/MocA family oxidoreductase [Gaiellaceae bacterium]